MYANSHLMDSNESSAAAPPQKTDPGVQQGLELPDPNILKDTNDGASTESLESGDDFSDLDSALGGIRSYQYLIWPKKSSNKLTRHSDPR